MIVCACAIMTLCLLRSYQLLCLSGKSKLCRRFSRSSCAFRKVPGSSTTIATVRGAQNYSSPCYDISVIIAMFVWCWGLGSTCQLPMSSCHIGHLATDKLSHFKVGIWLSWRFHYKVAMWTCTLQEKLTAAEHRCQAGQSCDRTVSTQQFVVSRPASRLSDKQVFVVR